MNNILEVAKQAAIRGGDIIQAGAKSKNTLNIEQKSLHDYVSEVDRNSERAVIDTILAEFPDHQIVGEEYGRHAGSSNISWIVDPLDGTTNFLRGIPHYAVSIGVMIDGVLEHGVVYDPCKKEMFTASLGKGVSLNDELIRVSDLESVRGGLYATGIPFSSGNLDNIEYFTDTLVGILQRQTSGVRRLGSAALDLAYVAAGRYDGYWEANLQIWDIAAGALLVTEAGGLVSDLHGRQQQFETGNILAAGAAVHADLLQITSECYSPAGIES